MPFYMDRHDLGEPTPPEYLAKAHYQDILIQDEHGCKALTYWHSEDKKTAFCLIHAPSAEKLKDLHAASHGLVPNDVIEVDLSQVEVILGRTSDPAPIAYDAPSGEQIERFSSAIDSAFRVIMFTDLQDSTPMFNELGQKKALELLHIHNKMIRKAVRAVNGTEVKHTGDGFMLSFRRVDDALRCAFAIQRAFSDYNRAYPKESLHVRIGMSAGEPVFQNNDFFGATVNLASRLCAASEPGGVLVSTDIHEICEDPLFVFTDAGAVPLKGFKDAVQVYRVSENTPAA